MARVRIPTVPAPTSFLVVVLCRIAGGEPNLQGGRVCLSPVCGGDHIPVVVVVAHSSFASSLSLRCTFCHRKSEKEKDKRGGGVASYSRPPPNLLCRRLLLRWFVRWWWCLRSDCGGDFARVVVVVAHSAVAFRLSACHVSPQGGEEKKEREGESTSHGPLSKREWSRQVKPSTPNCVKGPKRKRLR